MLDMQRGGIPAWSTPSTTLAAAGCASAWGSAPVLRLVLLRRWGQPLRLRLLLLLLLLLHLTVMVAGCWLLLLPVVSLLCGVAKGLVPGAIWVLHVLLVLLVLLALVLVLLECQLISWLVLLVGVVLLVAWMRVSCLVVTVDITEHPCHLTATVTVLCAPRSVDCLGARMLSLPAGLVLGGKILAEHLRVAWSMLHARPLV
jgi:hypothetical protein